MSDLITPAPPVTGQFDSAAIQLAQAKAQAAAAGSNEAAFLQEIAKSNGQENAHALDSAASTPPTDVLQTADKRVDPAILSLFGHFANDNSFVTSDSIKAKRLHDIGVLQKDAELLQEAAIDHHHIPLSSNASTVDLSSGAQNAVSGLPPTSEQLAQVAGIIQPIANLPLTPALLQNIQDQLVSVSNHIDLSINNLSLTMSYIAGMQASPNHLVDNAVTKVDHQIVAPVAAISKIAAEDSTIR